MTPFEQTKKVNPDQDLFSVMKLMADEDAVAESHVSADAVVEFPDSDVVFRIVVTNRQPTAIRLHVEQNT